MAIRAPDGANKFVYQAIQNYYSLLEIFISNYFLASTKRGVFFKLLVVNLCLHFGGRQLHLAQHSTVCQKHEGNKVVSIKQKPQKIYAITFQGMTPAKKKHGLRSNWRPWWSVEIGVR